MPVRTKLPQRRTAAVPWYIFTRWRSPSYVQNDGRSGSYPGGVVPAWTWQTVGIGTLLDALQSPVDGIYAQYHPTLSGDSQFLLVEFAIDTPNTTLTGVVFRVARFVPPQSGKQVKDLHVYLVKDGVVLTGVDRAKTANWAHTTEAAPEMVYYSFGAADLVTLGVTQADVDGGRFGLAIQITAVVDGVLESPIANIAVAQMQLAYNPVPESDVALCELPGGITPLPSSWLKIDLFTGGGMSKNDTILGIEVDLTAWTSDYTALPHASEITTNGQVNPDLPPPPPPPPAPQLDEIPIDPGGGGGGGDPPQQDTGVVGLPGGDGGDWGTVDPGYPLHSYPLEIALSIDGINPVGIDTWLVYTTSQIQQFTVGGSSYLWNKLSGWKPKEFGQQFCLLVRRPSTLVAVSSQYVTSARVRVTTTSSEGTLTMGVRQTLTELVLIGPENVAPGTETTAYKRLRMLNYKTRPNVQTRKHRPQGEKMNALSTPVREWGSGSISGPMDYNELPLVFEAIMGTGVHSGTGVADQRNVHTYMLENRKRSIKKTYSVQRGEADSRAHGHLYLVHNGVQLQINTQDCQVSGSFFCQKINDPVTLATGANEVQSITITGAPTGGTYKLGYRGAETTALAFGALAAAITTALEALSTIGAGNVVVTGTLPNLTATFGVGLAGENLPMIYLAKNSLTGGTTPSVTIAQATRGGYGEYGLAEILPAHWNVYMADTQATLTAGKLDKSVGVSATGIDVADRFQPFYTLDRDLVGTFTGDVEMDPKFKANFQVGANSTGMGLLSTLRNGATKWLRMEAVGPVIGVTTDPYKMIWEGCVKVDDAADFGDEDGRVVYPWSLEWCEGPNGEVPTVTFENGVITY